MFKSRHLQVVKHYQAMGSIGRKVGSGRPTKVTAEIKKMIDDLMKLDDEITPYQLYRLLTEKGYSISLRTTLRCRTAFGWTFRGSTYCQLIHEVSDWLWQVTTFTIHSMMLIECTVQIGIHRQLACQKHASSKAQVNVIHVSDSLVCILTKAQYSTHYLLCV